MFLKFTVKQLIYYNTKYLQVMFFSCLLLVLFYKEIEKDIKLEMNQK